MSADVLQLPDRARDLAAAREIIKRKNATDEQRTIASDIMMAEYRRLNDEELASIGYPADGGTIGRVLDGQAAYQAAEGGRGETRMMLAVIAVAFFCAASLATFAFGADVPGQYAERGEW